MKRRAVLRGVTLAGIGALSGSLPGNAVAQSPDDVDAKSYDQLDNSTFPSNVSLSWVADRFIQVRSEDAPVVGHEVETTALVLERVTSAEEHRVLREQFDWDEYDYTGTDGFSTLFSALAWPLTRSIGSEFFDSHDLVWLTGIDQDLYRDALVEEGGAADIDQEFYDLYGHTPFMFAAVESSRSPQPGTVADVSATVRYTGEDGPLPDGDGGYLELEQVSPRESLRTDASNWQQDARARFTGLQRHPRPELSTSVTTVEYDDDLPRPQGGSLLAKEGRVLDAGGGGSDSATQHSLESTGHDMLVGDFLPSTWGDDEDDTPESGQDGVNISVVIDTSGSMGDRDTGWHHDDGTEKSRLAVAQESAKMFLDFLEAGHTVSLVEFDYGGSTVSTATVLDDTTREAFKRDVDSLSDNGGTSIGGGLRQGYQNIQNESGPKIILLLSDGVENEPPMVADVLPELRNQGIRIFTIGMGGDIDETQLEYIAEQTGGAALWDYDPGEVRNFFGTFGIDTQQRSRHTELSATVDEGDVLEDDCKVDGSCEDVQFALSYEGSEMDLVVTDPNGNELQDDVDVSHREGAAHEVWTVEDPPTGDWQYEVDVKQVDDPQEARVQVSSDSPIDTSLFVSDALYEQTGFVRFQLKVEDGLQRYTDATAELAVIPPSEDEPTETVTLYDDGGGADDVEKDGIYSNYFHPTEPGQYEFTAIVSGGEYDELERESSHTAEIETVVDDPIRPFELRDDSWLSLPLIVGGVTGLGGLYYYLTRIRGGGGRGTGGPQSKQGTVLGGAAAGGARARGTQHPDPGQPPGPGSPPSGGRGPPPQRPSGRGGGGPREPRGQQGADDRTGERNREPGDGRPPRDMEGRPDRGRDARTQRRPPGDDRQQSPSGQPTQPEERRPPNDQPGESRSQDSPSNTREQRRNGERPGEHESGRREHRSNSEERRSRRDGDSDE